jgi:hypothetical protein
MPASSNPLAPNHNSNNIIKLKSYNRRSTADSFTNNLRPIFTPGEMP